MYYSVFIDNHFFPRLCLQWKLCLLQRVGSCFIVFPSQASNNIIWLFPETCHLGHASNWHNAISISLAEKQRHAYFAACSVGSGQRFAIKPRCFSCVYFGLFIILKQTTIYANCIQKQPIQQISNSFFPVFFQRLLCSLCIFDKSSQAIGCASLCVICQREING